jgi:hypothetical protein
MDPPPTNENGAKCCFFQKKERRCILAKRLRGMEKSNKTALPIYDPPLSLLLLHSNKSRPRSVCRYRVYIDV